MPEDPILWMEPTPVEPPTWISDLLQQVCIDTQLFDSTSSQHVAAIPTIIATELRKRSPEAVAYIEKHIPQGSWMTWIEEFARFKGWLAGSRPH